MSGYTVWRRRHGTWQVVTPGLSPERAQEAARIHNAEAKAEATGYTFCVTPDRSTPDVKRGKR